MCLLSVWRPNILPLDHQVPITSMIWFHLKCWMDSNHFVQGTFIYPPISMHSFSWMPAHLEPRRLSFYGRWMENQSQHHINILEIMVIRFALKKAIQYIHRSYVVISTDNTTVVSYINKQGVTDSPIYVYGKSSIGAWITTLYMYSEFVISPANSTF